MPGQCPAASRWTRSTYHWLTGRRYQVSWSPATIHLIWFVIISHLQNENIVFSDSRDCECKKMLKQGSISPTKTLFCGNTFNDVVTLGAPRRGKTAILIRLHSVFKLVSGHFYVESLNYFLKSQHLSLTVLLLYVTLLREMIILTAQRLQVCTHECCASVWVINTHDHNTLLPVLFYF